MKSPIAVLASGGGSTAEAYIMAGVNGVIDSQVGVVICSREGAGIFSRIDQLNSRYGLNIDCLLINGSTHPAAHNETVMTGCQTEAEQAAIIDALKQRTIDVIALLGYMKRVGPTLVRTFGWQAAYTSPYQASMVNTHPGLLPETKGMYGVHVQEHVLQKQLPYSGQTLHIVAEEYDEGPVLAEHKVAVEPGDSPDGLFDRVRELEKYWVPRDIDAFIKARAAYRATNTEA